jgi:hypothetical protein
MLRIPNFIVALTFLVFINAFSQKSVKLRNTPGPLVPNQRQTVTFRSNCRFGQVWGNFRKTCATPGLQVNALPKKKIKLQTTLGSLVTNQRGPATFRSNCRFGIVWGNFRKTCTSPEHEMTTKYTKNNFADSSEHIR